MISQKMIFICMIMLVLVPTTSATGIMECNFTQHDDQQCYGAVGEPLIFHLPVHGRMTLRKNKEIIFKLVNNTSLESTSWYDKSYKFLKNGICKLDNTTKTDSGVYQLEVYAIDGREIKTINISVQILAPVSHPSMFQTWLSPEQRTISCSTEGEVTRFSFYLDNNSLIQIKAGSAKKESVTISLNGQLTGNLQCKVQNKVSSKQTVIHLTSCEGVRSPTMTVLGSVTVPLLLLILILVVKLLKKRRGPTSIREENAEDQIVYSDVRATQATPKMDV